MTELLFRADAYAREATGHVKAITTEGGIILDGSLFYPTSGGQPGDSGTLRWGKREIEIATTVKGEGDDVILLPSEPAGLPSVGQQVAQHLNWDRRYRLMRVHTALHLLSVVIPSKKRVSHRTVSTSRSRRFRASRCRSRSSAGI